MTQHTRETLIYLNNIYSKSLGKYLSMHYSYDWDFCVVTSLKNIKLLKSPFLSAQVSIENCPFSLSWQ